MQKRETKAINKLCVREILSLSCVCGAYFFEFRGQNLVCFGIAYNFNGKFAARKAHMRTSFFTRVRSCMGHFHRVVCVLFQRTVQLVRLETLLEGIKLTISFSKVLLAALRICKLNCKAPFIWFRVPETTLPPSYPGRGNV